MSMETVYSFLTWGVAGIVCVLTATLISNGRTEDFRFVIGITLFIGIISASIISGILSYLNLSNTMVSLGIVLLLSIYIGVEFRHDIGFWNYSGDLEHLLKIIKNCICYFPITYFVAGYLATMILKKGLMVFIK